MNALTLSLLIAGIVYILWFLFVLALASSLKEIKKTTWHYQIYVFLADRYPKNSCDYGKMLTAAPVIFAFIGFLLTLWSLFVIIRFFFNWLIWPFLTGRIPEAGLSKKYFKEVIDFGTLPHDLGAQGIHTKKFMRPSPFLWTMVLAFVSAVIWESYRVVAGLATGVETNILLTAFGVFIVTLPIIWLVKKPCVKTMYALAKERLCRNIPVVD